MTTYVQHAYANPASDPQGIAYTSNVVSGNQLYFLALFSAGTTISTDSITDTVGSTWSSLAEIDTPSYRAELWTAVAAGSGANTVTANFSADPSGSSSGVFVIFELSGMGTITYGGSNTRVESTPIDPFPCATFSATGPGVAFCVFRNSGGAHNFVQWNDSFSDAGDGTRSRAGYRVFTGTPSLAPEIDFVDTEIGESATFVVYEESVGGGGETTYRPRRRMTMGVG